MPVDESTSGAMTFNVAGAGLSGPDDSIFDAIWDWISGTASSLWDWITSALSNLWNNIVSWFSKLWTSLVTRIANLWSDITGWFSNLWNNITGAFARLWSNITSFFSNIWSNISGWFSRIWSSITGWFSTLWTNITGAFARLWSNITSFFSNIWSNISSWFSNLWNNITGAFARLWSNISGWFSNLWTNISSAFYNLWSNITGWFSWLVSWLSENIPKFVMGAFDFIVNRLLDFGSWIGALLDSIWSWMNRDVPGHSNWFTDCLGRIGHWFATWFYEFPKWFFGDLPENIAYGLQTSFAWVGRTLSSFTDACIDTVMGFVKNIGPVAPSMSGTNAKSILTIASTAIIGLSAMTVAGELLHPLKNLGLGNLAAMIYDMSNYRLITAAFFGALTYALIRLPTQWYYLDIFRPQLPSIREGMDFYSSDDIELKKFSRLLGFHGIPDEWHDAYADSAFKAPSPYQLSVAAGAGAIDEEAMLTELRRAGFHPRMRQLFIDAFKKSATGNLKTVMVSAATGRFKEGITDEAGLTAELKILNVGDSLVPLYVAGAKLQYQTDYILDLVTAYTTAVTSGNMSIEEFRKALLGLGIVPERVEAGVLKLKAKLRPKEKLTPIGAPGEIYLTDRGRLQVDTIRIRRTKNTITRAQELNMLGALGVPTDYATAIADNDDAKLLEKTNIEPAAAVPVYKTDAGKVKLDSIRDRRRKNTIDATTELTELAALGVPEYLATAIADNDTITLEEKIPTAAAPTTPLYETEAGKIKVDTIRRSRRKLTMTREDEFTALQALEMPDWLASTIVENDDIRLTGKAEGE